MNSRVSVPSNLVGEIVRILGSEVYEDIFGLHLGCFIIPKWDPEGKYIFHSILSSHDGAVHNYCLTVIEAKVIMVIR